MNPEKMHSNQCRIPNRRRRRRSLLVKMLKLC